MVYFIYSKNDNKIKIGFTKNSPIKRLKQLNTGNSSKLILLGYIDGDKNTETNIRNQFHYLKENLEWINVDKLIIDYINKNNLLDNYCEITNGTVQVYKKIKKVI